MQSTQSSNQANQLDDSELTEPKLPTGNNLGLGQAYKLRNLSADQALALGRESGTDPKNKIAYAQGICALIKAWAEASDRIRILRGKPLPGSLRPIAKPKKAKHISSAPSEEPSQPPTEHA